MEWDFDSDTDYFLIDNLSTLWKTNLRSHGKELPTPRECLLDRWRKCLHWRTTSWSVNAPACIFDPPWSQRFIERFDFLHFYSVFMHHSFTCVSQKCIKGITDVKRGQKIQHSWRDCQFDGGRFPAFYGPGKKCNPHKQTPRPFRLSDLIVKLGFWLLYFPRLAMNRSSLELSHSPKQNWLNKNISIQYKITRKSFISDLFYDCLLP